MQEKRTSLKVVVMELVVVVVVVEAVMMVMVTKWRIIDCASALACEREGRSGT